MSFFYLAIILSDFPIAFVYIASDTFLFNTSSASDYLSLKVSVVYCFCENMVVCFDNILSSSSDSELLCLWSSDGVSSSVIVVHGVDFLFGFVLIVVVVGFGNWVLCFDVSVVDRSRLCIIIEEGFALYGVFDSNLLGVFVLVFI